MKTILMLIVGLMLAGCGSMENHVRNRADRIVIWWSKCGGHDMRLPLTIKPGRCLRTLPATLFAGSR